MLSHFKTILLLLSCCGPVFASAPLPTPVVTTEVAKEVELAEHLSYPARVESVVNALISSEIEGVVSKILTPLGTKVTRGQAVAVIKHTDPVYQYAPMTLKAPVSGIVSQVPLGEGSAVTKGSLVAAVTDPRQIKVVIEIAASDVSYFSKGSAGTYQGSGVNQDSSKLEIKVEGVSPFVDPATGTATCNLTLVKTEGHVGLIPGAVGQVYFDVNHHRGFSFPDTAIVYRGNNTFVRIVENGVAKKIPVVLGKRERGKVEILSGVKEGDVVISRASQFIADGDKVKVENGG